MGMGWVRRARVAGLATQEQEVRDWGRNGWGELS